MIFQHFSADGAVLQTQFVGHDAEIPDYAVLTSPPAVAELPATPTPIESSSVNRGRLVSAGITLGGAAALYGAAYGLKVRYSNTPNTAENEQSRATMAAVNHVLVVTSGLAAAGGVVVGVTAF
mgnify:CR=1 FL=1